MRTKQIARDIFYTGNTRIVPTEDETLLLKQKYGLTVPNSNNFQKQVNSFLNPADDAEDAEEHIGSMLSKITRGFLSRLYDEIEDDYNLDLPNRDPKKYEKLEDNFTQIQKAIWRKVSLSKLPEPEKNSVAKRILKATTVSALLSYLEFGSLDGF